MATATSSMATFAAKAKAHFEGLCKENSTDVKYHSELYGTTSKLEWLWLVSPMKAVGPEAVAAVHKNWWTLFPDLKVSFTDICIDEKKGTAILWGNLTGTVAATGKKLKFEACLKITAGEDGKMAAGKWNTDFTYLMTAAGAYNPLARELMKGRPTIHLVWVVPAGDEEKEVDAYWKKHESWMRESHSMGLNAAEEPRLLSFNICKGEQLKNPLNSAEGKTGKIQYIMSEIYAAAEGVGKHMALATAKGEKPTDLLPQLMIYHKKYGQFMEVGACTVFTSYADDATPFDTRAGDTGIHLVWKVPAEKTADVDAYWRKHEMWMRESHTMGRAGDDKTGPRLTSFTIAKGEEFKNPLKPEEGKTGKILYIMDETYVAAAGVGKHMELASAKGDKPTDLLPELQTHHAAYGTFMEVGSSAVMTCFADK